MDKAFFEIRNEIGKCFLFPQFFGIIKVLEGLPNLLRGFREGFTIKTSIVVEGSS